MIVRTAADSFEKPMINIFQNLGPSCFSWMVRHCSIMMGCNFQKYIFASLGFSNGCGKRHKRGLYTCRFRPQEMTRTVKSNLHKCLTGKANDGFNCVCLEWKERLDNFLVWMPCRPPCAALTALLKVSLTQILPSWLRTKVLYFSLQQDSALYKCQQMNPDKVINQFNRMKSLYTKRWHEIIA